MAKKKDDSRNYAALARMDKGLYDKMHKLAVLRNLGTAEFLDQIVRPVITKEWSKEVRKLKEDDGA